MSKAKKRIFVATLGLSVPLIIAASYSSVGRFLFAQGSDVFAVARPSLGTALLGGVIFLLGVFLASRIPRKTLSAIVLIASVMLLLLFNRAVGVAGDGRVIGGWFFLQTKRVELRGEMEPMDTYIVRWHATAVSGWRIEFKSVEDTEYVFVGPLMMSEFLELLRERGFRVTPH